MKKTTTTTKVAGDDIANAVVLKVTEGKSPLPSEILLGLGATFGAQQVAAMMGDADEIRTARGVMAGIVTTLQVILPPAQFRDVMIQWEVDIFKLTEFQELALTQSAITI